MYTDDFLSKTQEIIKAYKGFSIFKSGSAIDKFFLCLFVFVYIVASGLLFWANVFSKNFVLFIVSLILLIVSFVATYFFSAAYMEARNKSLFKTFDHRNKFLALLRTEIK